MQKLAEICIRRPVFATMLILFLVVMGLDAYRKLGVDFFPKVEFPIVTITTTLRGAAPEEVESQVTKRIEEAVNTISGIDDLTSISAEGVSLVNIQFVLSKDADVAAQEVRDKVSRIVSQLPDDTDEPIVDKIATDASPVLSIVVASPRALRETTKIVERFLAESGSDNTYLQNDLGLEVRITGSLGLRVGYQVRRNSDVPPGVEKTDTLTTVGLLYETK